VSLDDRDYMNHEHYPSCTCVACWKKRSERAAEKWCSKHERPKGQSGCQLCLLESKDVGVPDNSRWKLHRSAIGDVTAARESVPSATHGVHSGSRLGRALRGVLVKRRSA
jgi:hypothetical protein